MTGTSLQQGDTREAEQREILEPAVSPQGRVKLGSLLADIGRQARLSDAEIAVFEQLRCQFNNETATAQSKAHPPPPCKPPGVHL